MKFDPSGHELEYSCFVLDLVKINPSRQIHPEHLDSQQRSQPTSICSGYLLDYVVSFIIIVAVYQPQL